ncbi:homeobox protein PKNOX2-like isoform X2 [Planococcus citri]|uniref:homeobox protein PKNOX2-like isoform X2 n=1 Tax=Planococcus citri TaxID=170843 RepID=UPI0031F87DA9
MIMVSYSANQASVNNCNQATDPAVFEADKRAVYKHPLFPLLALVFERCEQATQCAEIPNSEGFNMDIQAFVQHQEKDKRPFLTNDAEVDGLMIKAIQVLRIHLLELEKVQELCKDFCTRYITCLKGKMQSENLLKPDYTRSYSENNSSSGHSSDSNSPLSYSPRPFQSDLQVVSAVVPSEQMYKDKLINSSYSQTSPVEMSGAVPAPATAANQLLSINCAVTTSEPTQSSTPSPGVILESLSPVSGTSCDETDDHFGNRRKQKRGVLPKYATSIMRSWLFQHLVHPYPTEDEKKQIAAQTNLTLLQVNNWFINARRRILQPMLDASASDKKGTSNVASDDSDSECSENEIQITERIQPYSEEDTNQ